MEKQISTREYSNEFHYQNPEISDVKLVWDAVTQAISVNNNKEQTAKSYLLEAEVRYVDQEEDVALLENTVLGFNRYQFQRLYINNQHRSEDKMYASLHDADLQYNRKPLIYEIGTVYPEYHQKSKDRLKHYADALRAKPTTQLNQEPEIIDPRLEYLRVITEQPQIETFKNELWSKFESLDLKYISQKVKLQELSINSIITKANNYWQYNFEQQVFKEMLIALHPDKDDGDEKLYKVISDHYNRLKQFNNLNGNN